ncbi:MAG: PAS domain S-box protein [Legionellales bacterium]|nr:PAS domain S-box protein [Legionellales bacterium]
MDSQFSYFFRLSAVLEAMPDSLVIIDDKARIVLVNRQTEKLFGYERTELLGSFIEQLMPERFRDRHQQHRNHYISEPRTRPMGAGLALYGLHKNGQEFPVEISLSPLKTDEGTLILAAVRDISTQKQLEEALRAKNVELEEQNRRAQEANRLKSEFLANMSHELRTPLNGIIGFTELMHDEKVGSVSVEHKEYLGDILTSARHLLQLINDVLDLAKVEAGKMDFYPESVEPAKLVAEISDILRTMIAKKKMQLETTVDPQLGTLLIDPAKLKQVLYNYLSNAIKFTPDGGQIKIRIMPQGDENFLLEVHDTGAGIKKSDFNKLFVEFQQLDASVSKKHQGTGLGLALTRRIVEAQGGEVGVKSKVGQGSIFYAILPKKPTSKNAVQEKMVPSAPLLTVSEPLRVLVVEDDSRDRLFICETLTNAGYQVKTAINGTEALHQMRTQRFDAITLDLLLPDMRGVDVLLAIKTEGLNKNAPLIVISVLSEKAANLDFKMNKFLVKPIQADELLLAMKEISNGR